MTTPNENEKVPATPIVDPFPKPNTIPSGWDVSAFKVDTRAASAEKSPARPKSEDRNLEVK